MGLSARAQFTPRSSTGQFIQSLVTPGVVGAVTAVAQQLLTTAQANAPVDTGELRDSGAMEVNQTAKTVVGRVSFGAPYAAYVEFGTGRRGAESADRGPGPYKESWPGMAPQPYLRPAADEMRGLILGLFAGAISISI